MTGKVWSSRWCCRKKGTKTTESAFRGETVRKFSGCKLLQSRSWARGHESVVSDGSVERPHHIVRAMPEDDLVYVELPEGLYEHNDTVWCLKRALNGFEGRFSTLP